MTQGGKIVALVVAAGSGSRAGGELPKQYALMGGKPLLAHALAHLEHPRIDEVRVVIGAGQEEPYAAIASAPFTIGGATRQQSVRNGLEAIAAGGGADIVLIHDAARPFLPSEVIDRLLAALDEAEGAVPALASVDTLAWSNGRLGDVVDRSNIVRVQTPQSFRFDSILKAHRAWSGDHDATDDAQVARAAGLRVVTVEGDRLLDKITYADDVEAAERRLAANLVTCTGMGFDVHAFEPGDGIWLGGLNIPHDRRLKGHSDADVALHALTDALLGAIGEGDIGTHFPPSDPQWRGAPSSTFLEYARMLVERKGGRIDHADVTIICEEPRVGPHREAMRENIARLLGVPVGRISVKATTTERLGFTGRSEGMAAQAIASVRLPEEE